MNDEVALNPFYYEVILSHFLFSMKSKWMKWMKPLYLVGSAYNGWRQNFHGTYAIDCSFREIELSVSHLAAKLFQYNGSFDEYFDSERVHKGRASF